MRGYLKARKRDPRLIWFWRVTLVAVLVGSITWVGGRPAYRWVKNMRARRLVEQAVSDVEAGRWDEVARTARVAVGLAPHHPRVHWLLARLYSVTGNREGLDHWNTLAGTTPLSREDRLAWTRLATQFDRIDIAGRLISDLVREAPNDPEVTVLAMDLSDRQGWPDTAIALGREWLNAAPNDREPTWELGRRLFRRDNPAAQAEGRRLLWPLVLRPGPHQEQAGALLAADPNLTRGEREQIRRLLLEAEASPVILASLDLALDPGKREEILAGVAEHARTGTNRVELARSLAWLAENDGLEQVVSVLTPERIRTEPELAGTRLQALVELGRLDEARAEMERPGGNVPPHLRRCIEAWVAREAGREEEADDRLIAAVADAENSPAHLSFVAQYALRLGRTRPALRAVDRLAERQAGSLDSVRTFLRLAVSLDDLSAVRRAADALRVRLPGDSGVRAFVAYLAFLAKQGSRSELEWLTTVDESSRASEMVMAARGLARWRLGEAGQGLEELEASGRDLSAASSRLRFVHTVLLAANQRREAARQISRGIPPGELLGEERRILAELIP